MRYILRERRGYLYVVGETMSWEAPQKELLWYPIGKPSDAYERYLDEPLRYDLTKSLYVLDEDGEPQFRTAYSTPAIVEVESVPRPRTSAPIRWRNGRWEKRLKRQGWVAA